MSDLSIIIVNYNTKNLLRELLESIFNSSLNKYQIEVFVVDNGSEDGSKEMVKNIFPRVRLIAKQKNLGFAKANNLGIKKSRGKYLLFLNSDTFVFKNTLVKMLKFMDENKDCSAATCRVELADARLDLSCHRGFPTPWAAFTYFSGLELIFPRSRLLGQYHQGWKDLNQIHEVDVISGAFFLIRKKALEQTGSFDERFFMYAEDIDLCYRLKRKGLKICFNPNTKIIHYKTSSGRKKNKGKGITQKDKEIRKKTSEYFFETMKLFYDKHYQRKYPWLIRQLVLVGIRLVSKIKN